jgi:zinc protease
MIEVMNLKIIDILREKLSLIYSGGMSGSLDRIPYAHYRIGAYLPCGPENVDKVISAMLAEIEKIKNDGPQPSDVEKIKQNWLKDYQIAMRTNGRWLASLQDSVLYGTDPADILTFEKRVNAITPAELKEAANRYFNVGNYVQAVMYPGK